MSTHNNVSGFMSRLGWLFAGEGAARIMRLFTAIVLSRYLTPFEFGLAALILSFDEIVKILTRNGIGQKIIQCREADLDAVCNRVYRINWYVHIGLFLISLAFAKPMSIWFDFEQLQYLIPVVAITYLIYPLAMVQVNLVLRAQDMKSTGCIYGLQVGTDNLLTAILALSGLGIWAIVIPKIIVAPIWVFAYRRINQWRFNAKAEQAPVKQVWSFSIHIFYVELLRTTRQYADRILIGVLLGVETLGIYYFAVNAGAGLSYTLIKVFTTVVMPDLSHQARKIVLNSGKQALDWLDLYESAFIRYLFIITPIVLLQLVLAPVYVPIVFGQHWAHAIPILMVLCGATIFQGLVDVGAQVFRASAQTQLDVKLNAISTATYFIAIGLGYLIAPNADEQLFYISIAILINTIAFAIMHFNCVVTTLSSEKVADTP